jgi:hypothetical protein
VAASTIWLLLKPVHLAEDLVEVSRASSTPADAATHAPHGVDLVDEQDAWRIFSRAEHVALRLAPTPTNI